MSALTRTLSSTSLSYDSCFPHSQRQVFSP